MSRLPKLPCRSIEVLAVRQRDQGFSDRSVAVRVELHAVADDVGDFDEFAVVVLLQRKQDAPLHGLKPVVEVGDGAVADDVGGILQKILVHEPLEWAFAGRLQAAADGLPAAVSGSGSTAFHVAEKRQFLLSVRHGSTSTTRWFMMYCRRSGVLRPM